MLSTARRASAFYSKQMKIILLIGLATLLSSVTIAQDRCAKMPVKDGTIGSLYGWRKHPVQGSNKFHAGLDIRAKYGNDVFSAFDGRILEVKKNNKAYGNTIKIAHENGLISFYAHLSIIDVKKGQIICKGDIIGKIGTSGNATGPHLHFEIIEQDKKLNPLLFL